MPSSNQASGRPYWNSGRGFASQDPERQVEVLGYVRNTPIETLPARPAAVKPAQRWTRVQPDVESSFEGSSSRRWR
jgi:hypothetical protein